MRCSMHALRPPYALTLHEATPFSRAKPYGNALQKLRRDPRARATAETMDERSSSARARVGRATRVRDFTRWPLKFAADRAGCGETARPPPRPRLRHGTNSRPSWKACHSGSVWVEGLLFFTWHAWTSSGIVIAIPHFEPSVTKIGMRLLYTTGHLSLPSK